MPKGRAWTALMEATLWGRNKCVDVLILAGANVNKQDQSGWTALMYAAWLGKDKCVESLIYGGADVNIQDRNGGTAVMKAAEWGHEKCIDILTRPKNNIDVLRLSHHLCRASITKHLLQINDKNMFVVVPKLGLPKPLMNFLLSSEILDEDDIAFLSFLLL